jgi:CO/xanthine dehydrogenase FAD-binding subunit
MEKRRDKMIPFEFIYMVPETIKEAVDAWEKAEEEGKKPLYYAGGTEIISFCRSQKICPGVLIDIKKIKECTVLGGEKNAEFGAALTLNTVAKHTRVPLLEKVITRIADHTIRNKLTLGGNVMGHLPYREAILPFLVLDGSIKIAGSKGTQSIPLADIFDKRVTLSKGEFVVSLSFESKMASANWFFQRKEKDGRVDYPILSACFAGDSGTIKMAVSGAFSFPVRNRDVEIILNTPGVPGKVRAQKVVDMMNDDFRSDFRASANYRKHLLKLAIIEGLKRLERSSGGGQ